MRCALSWDTLCHAEMLRVHDADWEGCSWLSEASGCVVQYSQPWPEGVSTLLTNWDEA